MRGTSATLASTHRYVYAFPAAGNVASNALCRTLGFEPLGEFDVEYHAGTDLLVGLREARVGVSP